MRQFKVLMAYIKLLSLRGGPLAAGRECAPGRFRRERRKWPLVCCVVQ
jgi:hypothetical protein